MPGTREDTKFCIDLTKLSGDELHDLKRKIDKEDEKRKEKTYSIDRVVIPQELEQRSNGMNIVVIGKTHVKRSELSAELSGFHMLKGRVIDRISALERALEDPE